MFKMLDISRIFKLFREEIQLNLFRKLVDIKIFHIRRNGAGVVLQHGGVDISCLLHQPEEGIVLDTCD